MVTADTLAAWKTHAHVVQRRAYPEQCRSQRTKLCEAVGIAEERLPVEALTEFWQRHLRYARLPVQYPEASVLRDCLPRPLVEACRGLTRAENHLMVCHGIEGALAWGEQVGRTAKLENSASYRAWRPRSFAFTPLPAEGVNKKSCCRP